jgi:branched-subunit amino acid ABC-type transport system permease component
VTVAASAAEHRFAVAIAWLVGTDALDAAPASIGATRLELVERARSGDPDAFEALVRAVGDHLLAVSRKILRDPDAAEDALQQAVIRGWRSLPRLRDPARFDQWLYLFTLAVLVVMFVIGWNLLRGRVGRAMVAIRDQPIAAEAMGVNSALVKALTFGVSALYTGVAGALGAIVVQFVAPDSFTAGLSINFLIGIVIGGIASISGALYGALFIQFVPNFADQISKAAPWAIYGAFLLVFIYAMPTGVAGFIRMLFAKLVRRLTPA